MGNSRRGPGVGEGPLSAASDGRILRCVATLLHPSAASAACDTERGGYSCSAREPLLPFLLLLLGHGRERGRTRRAPEGLAEEELASGRHGRLGAARYVSAPVCLFSSDAHLLFTSAHLLCCWGTFSADPVLK